MATRVDVSRASVSPNGARRFPSQPIAAVAVTICMAGSQGRRYALVKRSKPPSKGAWSIPGGKLQLGEAIMVGASREIEEEVGLTVASLRWHPLPITATDVIVGGQTTPEFHYVIAQCFAWHDSREETATPGDDAAEVAWFTMEEIASSLSAQDSDRILGVIRVAEAMMSGGVLVADKQ